MSNVYRQATGHLRTFTRKKLATSNSSTPTLANPTQSFSVSTSNPQIQRVNEVSSNLSLKPESIEEQPLSHDISRISLFRPQTKLTDDQLTDISVDRGGIMIPEALQRQCTAEAEAKLQDTTDTSVIQRDETTNLPPVPNYQLSPPSLLQPPDPTSRFRLGMDTSLQLDSQVQAMAMQYVQQQLNPATIRPALTQINLGILSTQGVGSPNTPNPFAIPTIPSAAPLVPAGAGPDTPRTATSGDLLQAIMAIPAIDGAITSLQIQAGERIQQDWRRLSTGEQLGVISTTALIAGGALAGVISDPSARRFALGQLNGKTLPVPGLNWLRLEINTGGDNLMLGMHVDVGRLLPPSLGFGLSSPQAIGAPPQPEP